MAGKRRSSRSRSASPAGKKGAQLAAPTTRLPVLLWPPNLIGYVRVAALVAAMCEANPASTKSLWMLTISLGLDYFDGPCARYLGMCSQFGDLLDHYTDHVTMMWLVYVATDGADTMTGDVNRCISAVHNTVAFVYMAYYGHYFKHTDKGNIVTRMIEQNNYWNLSAMLYAGNTILLPLLKLSLANAHPSITTPFQATTPLIDTIDVLGALVTTAYSFAVWL
eukprot:COSAG01_NODE_1318_length_10746_cov_96.891425_11_plen_222_part_00